MGGAELLGVGVPVGWGKVHALHTINVHVKSIHLHFLGCKSLSFTRSLLVFVALGYFEGPFACCFPEEFMNVYVYIYIHIASQMVQVLQPEISTKQISSCQEDNSFHHEKLQY